MKRFILAVAAGAVATFSACTAKQQPPAAPQGKALVQAFVTAWNKHDSAAFDTLMTKDALFEDVPSAFKGTGPADTKALMRDLIKMEPDYDWQLTNVIEEGPMMAVEWTWAGTYTGPSPNGPVVALRVSGRGSSFVETENGKIKRFTDYYDEASLFPKPVVDTTKKKQD